MEVASMPKHLRWPKSCRDCPLVEYSSGLLFECSVDGTAHVFTTAEPIIPKDCPLVMVRHEREQEVMKLA